MCGSDSCGFVCSRLLTHPRGRGEKGPEGTQHDTGTAQELEASGGWQGNGTSESSVITLLP